MDSLEKRLETLEYYQTLLLQMIEPNHFPFYRLVMEKGLSRREIEEVFTFCNELSYLHEEQKAQGLVIFTDLLTQFAGQLNPKLDIFETVQAMSKQGLYSSLMSDFLVLMK
ncbi:DUF1878 family protein [Metabacillus sediminilitoris]|jgi:hypothetical protein|uniref:DUF1878 family protein n=1 Tax=Metabacillus sediminilitoris TaxID=2567941 RepID=A0A4S4BY37_9BACI|nr:DUF1878 family protein [Metabacillus sediminilitoris]QGQ44529.1 DUF1878 family protein [Metabacillus sediminilitoris]THF80153.1 DUF1878 family protein [Metabacillus sediminilitoris]